MFLLKFFQYQNLYDLYLQMFPLVLFPGKAFRFHGYFANRVIVRTLAVYSPTNSFAKSDRPL